VFTVIAIGSSMPLTTVGEVKATGDLTVDREPIFKEAKKGARKKFTLRNLKDKGVMIFEGYAKDLPFWIDGDARAKKPSGEGFSSNTIRINCLYNLHGDPVVIKEYIETKNINPFFTCHDRVNHVDGDKETLVFMDKFASCKLVADKQTAQHAREGRDIEVGQGFSISSGN